MVIAPESATSEGVELYLRERQRPRFGWWLSYVYSSVTERVGGRDQRRWFDQPHALGASSTYRMGDRWTIATVWRYHTGWPSTRVDSAAEGDPFGLEYEVGPFYDERHPDYHSLDLRISRDVTVSGGHLSFFLDVQNLYDHRDTRGLEIEDWRLIRDGDR